MQSYTLLLFCTMKVGDSIKIFRPAMETLSRCDIKVDDYRYSELFQEFENLASDNKVS